MGTSTEAQKRAVIKYEKENVVQILVKLNRKTDADLIEILNEQTSKQGFIKDCIREHMKRGK